MMGFDDSEVGTERFEWDRTWRIGGLEDRSKVGRDGEGVAEAEYPVKASGVGKTMAEGLWLALRESKTKPPSSFFLVRPPQLSRIL